MNRAKALALLPVITAYANGLPIQHKTIISNTWIDVVKGGDFDEVSFSDSADRYRLPPPPPKRLYRIEELEGNRVWWSSDDEQIAKRELDRANRLREYGKYVLRTYAEVLEDGT